jgi:hypothetical protein
VTITIAPNLRLKNEERLTEKPAVDINGDIDSLSTDKSPLFVHLRR